MWKKTMKNIKCEQKWKKTKDNFEHLTKMIIFEEI